MVTYTINNTAVVPALYLDTAVAAVHQAKAAPGATNNSVCVLHIKAFFLPVDTQNTRCPCRFFLLERYKLCGHKTTTQQYSEFNAVSRVDKAYMDANELSTSL